MHRRTRSSLPGLHPLVASGNPLPHPVVTNKNVSRRCQIFPEVQNVPWPGDFPSRSLFCRLGEKATFRIVARAGRAVWRVRVRSQCLGGGSLPSPCPLLLPRGGLTATRREGGDSGVELSGTVPCGWGVGAQVGLRRARSLWAGGVSLEVLGGTVGGRLASPPHAEALGSVVVCQGARRVWFLLQPSGGIVVCQGAQRRGPRYVWRQLGVPRAAPAVSGPFLSWTLVGDDCS